MKPLNGNILIEPTHKESEMGLYMPTERKKSRTGKVIAVSGKEPSVEVGDTVIFDEYSVTVVEDNDGKKLYVIPEDKILVIL